MGVFIRYHDRLSSDKRFWLAGFAWVLCGLLSACQDSDGAVSFRWRIVDKSTGLAYDPRERALLDETAPGSCICAGQNTGAQCPPSGWRIDRIRLRVLDTTTGAAQPLDDADVSFVCRQREATTSFRVPIGTWGFTLEGYDPTTGMVQSSSAAAIVRRVKRAEIVNLDIIEMGVDITQ